MSHKNLAIALSLAVVLSATGCASLKGKKPVVEDTATTQTTPADTTTATDANSAETSGLNGKGGVNASGLGDNGANGQNGANASIANGKNGQNGSANGEVTMADLLTVRLVHFDYDSSDLSNADYQTLQAHAQYLSQNPTAKVLLAGHADERGTREYNMALGERRANAVQAYLNSNGAKSSQLDSVSYGKEKPLNDGNDEAAWAENRRVEIVYKAVGPK
ncbi:MAG: peptidoglycan-associated lipoprotein Pal [Agitococcus sp.]|nr:peptidoglycan-associated lipoprotein Pal [Agitococcus sp.]